MAYLKKCRIDLLIFSPLTNFAKSDTRYAVALLHAQEYTTTKDIRIMTKSFVTIADLSKEKIMSLLEAAARFEENPNRKTLDGKVIATLFFEPSTRTRLSFETAVNRLGGRVIGFSDAATSSSSKGESLKDTIMMVGNYADLIVMRHHLEGAARYASEVSPVPIINAGDGANQHPSQTMLDLYSIQKTQGTLENLHIHLVGDLKYGRTVHSLLHAMRHFNPTFHFIAPDELRMPEEYRIFCKENNIKINFFAVFGIQDFIHLFNKCVRERIVGGCRHIRIPTLNGRKGGCDNIQDNNERNENDSNGHRKRTVFQISFIFFHSTFVLICFSLPGIICHFILNLFSVSTLPFSGTKSRT